MNRNLIKWLAISFVLVVLAAFVLPGAVPISSLRLEEVAETEHFVP